MNHARPGDLEEVLAATGGEGPIFIVEMLADANLAADMTLAARYGRVVLSAAWRGAYCTRMRDDERARHHGHGHLERAARTGDIGIL